MSMTGFSGMNVEEVRGLAKQLHDQAGVIRQLLSTLDGHVHQVTWMGHDADMFKNDWWPQHRGELQRAAEGLEGFSTSAYNNAQAQHDASQV